MTEVCLATVSHPFSPAKPHTRDTPSRYLSTSTSTSSLTLPTHRLLYRGALSLPDSHILLDGLSFAAVLNADTEIDLLNHPLALGLESMRGRLSLHLLGAVKLSDLWIDEKSTGVVHMDIHPQATLSKLYFENNFCLEPITSTDGRSEYGVRISLSDSDDPSATDIVVYAQLDPIEGGSPVSALNVPSTSTHEPPILRILAARIIPGRPPSKTTPRPRPDDPTPRMPPPAFGSASAKRKRDASPNAAGKRSRPGGDDAKGKGKTKDEPDHETLRKARETMMHMPKGGSSSLTRTASAKSGDKNGRIGEFKVPKVPPYRASAAVNEISASQDTFDVTACGDVFGASQALEALVQQPGSTEQTEKANKLVVKQAVVRCLSDYSISKQHPEFHDVFQYVYRGTCFALRMQMRSSTLDLWSVFKLVDAHAKMYVQAD